MSDPIDVDFNETCMLFDPQGDDWDRLVLDEGHEVPCVFIQSIGSSHGSNADAETGTSRLKLDPNNEYMKSIHLRPEGKIALMNPYGNAADRQYFRIADAKVERDTLLSNRPRHVSCNIEPTYVPEVST